MLRLSIFAIFATTLAGHQALAEPELLWERDGLPSLESALPDSESGVIYVTSMHGEPTDKNGKGFISTLSLDGEVLKLDWATGLHAPKGMAIAGGKLYTADIDELVEIDLESGKVSNRYPAENAQFLNDVAAAPDGTVYVSDTFTDTIWRLRDGKFEAWLEHDGLKGPNGLLVEGDKLIVAGFGQMPEEGKEGKPANLVEVDIADKSVRDLGSGEPVGHLDGLEPLGDGSYLVTDWVNGGLFRIEASGEAERLLDLNQGSADIGYIPGKRIVLIPMMNDDKLLAYRLD
jgi:hypothetical protein